MVYGKPSMSSGYKHYGIPQWKYEEEEKKRRKKEARKKEKQLPIYKKLLNKLVSGTRKQVRFAYEHPGIAARTTGRAIYGAAKGLAEPIYEPFLPSTHIKRTKKVRKLVKQGKWKEALKESAKDFAEKQLAFAELGGWIAPVGKIKTPIQAAAKMGGVGAGFGALEVGREALKKGKLPTGKEAATQIGISGALGAGLGVGGLGISRLLAKRAGLKIPVTAPEEAAAKIPVRRKIKVTGKYPEGKVKVRVKPKKKIVVKPSKVKGRIDTVENAKRLGFKVDIASTRKGFTKKGFRYRIKKDKNLMYAHTPSDVAYLTGQTDKTGHIKPEFKIKVTKRPELYPKPTIPKELEPLAKEVKRYDKVSDFISYVSKKYPKSLIGREAMEKRGYYSLQDFFQRIKSGKPTGIKLEEKIGLDEMLKIGRKSVIPAKLEPLAKEARKYKSVKEFVKAKATLMRGAKTAEIKAGKVGVYLTPSKEYAKTFAGKDGVIAKAFANIKKTYKIPKADEYEWLDALIENPRDYSKYISELKSKGYDSILSSDGKQLLVFDRNKVLTKSQLTDIYTQATKGVKKVVPTVKPKVAKPLPKEIAPKPKGALQDIIPRRIKPKVIEVPGEQLPVGEGAKQISRLESRMKGTLKNVPAEDAAEVVTYQQMSKPEQMRSAAKYVAEKPDEALEVLKGTKPAPKGILYNSIGLALEERAKGTKNADLALKLASLRSTRAGQEIGILTEADPHSPVKYIAELHKKRMQAVGATKEKVSIIKAKEATSLKKAIRKSAPKRNEWASFIKSLEC